MEPRGLVRTFFLFFLIYCFCLYALVIESNRHTNFLYFIRLLEIVLLTRIYLRACIRIKLKVLQIFSTSVIFYGQGSDRSTRTMPSITLSVGSGDMQYRREEVGYKLPLLTVM